MSSSNWRNARERLFTLKREIDAALKTLEEVRQLCFQLADARRDVAKGEATLAALLAQRPPLEASRSHRQGDVEAAQKEYGRRAADVQQHRQIRPGFFVRLFRTEHWKVWSGTNAPLVDAEADAARLPQTAERALSQATVALNALVANIRKAEGSLTAPRQRVAQLLQSVDAQRHILGNRLVDEQFFTRGHEASNLAAPWIPDSVHRKREDLFIAALAVHRAFIDASAQKVLHNLSALMDVFSSGPMQDETKRLSGNGRDS